jgi:hypothetical protein
VNLHGGGTITAVEKAPGGTDPNVSLIRDSEGSVYVSIPGHGTYALRSDVIAAYPTLNLYSATKKYLGLD